MKLLITVAVLLFCCWRLPAQTPEALVRDVQANVASMSQLLKIIQKHAVSRDTINDWRFNDTVALLGHKRLSECYRYVQSAGSHTINKLVDLEVIYKAEQVAYIRIKDDYHDPAVNRFVKHTLLTYVDSAYSAGVLAGYNTKNGTNFTWHNLYEDTLTNFSVFPGLQFHYDSNGVMIKEPFLAEEMLPFVALIKKRNHAEIVTNCKSFNPTRKAFGAVCLYVLHQLGEHLSAEEKRLLKEIRASEETTDFSGGCTGSRGIPLKTFLTEKELRSIARQVISEGVYANYKYPRKN